MRRVWPKTEGFFRDQATGLTHKNSEEKPVKQPLGDQIRAWINDGGVVFCDDTSELPKFKPEPELEKVFTPKGESSSAQGLESDSGRERALSRDRINQLRKNRTIPKLQEFYKERELTYSANAKKYKLAAMIVRDELGMDQG